MSSTGKSYLVPGGTTVLLDISLRLPLGLAQKSFLRLLVTPGQSAWWLAVLSPRQTSMLCVVRV